MKNWVTTVIGILTLVLSGLALFGVIDVQMQNELVQYATEIIMAISGIVAIFSAKDELKTGNV
jgi:uncharacterized membrane protein (Fun14 family)